MEKLTAEQVKELPVGTKVILWGHDMSGDLTRMHCTVVQSGRHKMLSYWWMGGNDVVRIDRVDGEKRFYTLDDGEY